MDLGLDHDELATCVRCGLCLAHCPTFRVTGDEAQSPRGRIALMRAVQDGGAPLTGEVLRSFETCVQCRGCETACPSAVPYGRLIEGTRQALADAGRGLAPAWQRVAVRGLDHPRLVRAGTAALALGQRAGLVPARLGVPARLPLRQPALAASGDDVALFTGCVMDAWQRSVHRATQAVAGAAGFGVAPTGDAAPCCGALAAHAGMGAEARASAARVVAAVGADRPVLVGSAGCGAAMKAYGELLGTPEAETFSARVVDVQEWLAPLVDRLPAVEPLDVRVAVQDPCHLRHVQRVHLATRAVLAPFVREVVELGDDGLCCGAGGAYAVVEPELAGEIRARKLAAIGRVAPDVVASANPGCALHLAAGGTPTAHPVELVRAALSGAGWPR